jgi:adenylyltransferase/sulfurtransferase
MTSKNLTEQEFNRYVRHLNLQEIGIKGQEKIKQGKVLIVGAGGLGSPAALYLAAAGVGTIGLVDFDNVEENNLQRQIIHSTKNLGTKKTESAKKAINDLNPNVKVKIYNKKLNSNNALEIIKKYDVVIDGSDNFPTKYLINDACVLLKKPNVYGSATGFDGHASVFNYKNGPCYRCLFPKLPKPSSVPSCAEAGVLGALLGVIGTIQATEALKIILGKGNILSGRFLVYNALNMQFKELKLSKNKKCAVCGENPTIKELKEN